MANGVTISIQGLEQLRRQLGRMPRHLEDEIDAELGAASNEFVNRAVHDATKSVDTGRLRNEITMQKKKVMDYEVSSQAPYSAYIEWGTITFVSVPSELSAYAAEFKGKGILKTGGMKPRPFFFVQIPFVEKYLNINLNKAVQRVLNP